MGLQVQNGFMQMAANLTCMDKMMMIISAETGIRETAVIRRMNSRNGCLDFFLLEDKT
jgi:hypothetical protein